MKAKLFYALLLLVTAASAAIYAHSAKASQQQAAFGACYTLYNCAGGSMGSFTDIQCRSMGGHSMNSGGLCINL
jgi:hypothetical protein